MTEFKWLHPFIPLQAKNGFISDIFPKKSILLPAELYLTLHLHLDKDASQLPLCRNNELIWLGQENTPNVCVWLLTTWAPQQQPNLTFSHSLTSTLQAIHSCEQDGASRGPPGPCPAHMMFLKNILIDTAIKGDKSKQSSCGTSVRGESNPLPRASLSWECRLLVGDVWLVSQPERVHCKENIWE